MTSLALTEQTLELEQPVAQILGVLRNSLNIRCAKLSDRGGTFLEARPKVMVLLPVDTNCWFVWI